MRVRDVIKILRDHGFELDRQRGSHRQFEGVVDGVRRLVTISGKDGDDVPAPLLAAIRRQCGLPKKLFR